MFFVCRPTVGLTTLIRLQLLPSFDQCSVFPLHSSSIYGVWDKDLIFSWKPMVFLILDWKTSPLKTSVP